jgi:origin recognition complex subunit 1
MFNFFNWTTFHNSCLVLVGISNVFRLPDILQTRVASRLAVNHIIFSPYNHDQISEIIKSRLKDLSSSIIDQTKLELLSRKASHQSGDVRAALKICQK